MAEPDKWRQAVDHAIEEAMARGEFDYSRLKGKRMSQIRGEEGLGEYAMANKLLKNSGYAPPFLMKKREIEERLDKERGQLLRYALRRRRLLESAANAADEQVAERLTQRAEAEWQDALARFEAALVTLNKEIDLFNLMNKIPSLWKRKLRVERELERLEAQLEE